MHWIVLEVANWCKPWGSCFFLKLLNLLSRIVCFTQIHDIDLQCEGIHKKLKEKDEREILRGKNLEKNISVIQIIIISFYVCLCVWGRAGVWSGGLGWVSVWYESMETQRERAIINDKD